MQERITHPKDLAQLAQVCALADRVFLADKPQEHMAERYPALLGWDNRAHINLICEGDTPVTAVNWYPIQIKVGECVLTAGSIGSVCSDPAVRGRGYADALVKYTFAQMAAEGVALCLISGGRGLYRRNGAHEAGKRLRYHVEAGSPMEGAYCLPADRLTDGAPQVYALHSASRNRVLRGYAHTAALLAAQGYAHHHCVGELYGSDRAYALVWRNLAEPDAPVLRVVEQAGEPAAVAALLGHIAAVTGKAVTGYVPWHEPALASHLPIAETLPYDGTFRITHPGLLMEQLAPRLMRCGKGPVTAEDCGEGYVLSADGQTAKMDGAAFYRMLLTDGADAPLGLADVFPLELPLTDGLDYI